MERAMPEAIPIEIRRMVSRFGATATVAGLLTPAVARPVGPDAALIAECSRQMLIVYAAVEAADVAAGSSLNSSEAGLPSQPVMAWNESLARPFLHERWRISRPCPMPVADHLANSFEPSESG
jgi:hypothetical protein